MLVFPEKLHRADYSSGDSLRLYTECQLKKISAAISCENLGRVN